MFSSYDMTKLGSSLKRIRKACRLTQSNVYQLTGISPDTIRRIENGSVIPRYETLEILGSIYKYDLVQLLRNSRSSEKVTNLYSTLDQLILENDIASIKGIAANIDEYIDSISGLINPIDTVLLKTFVTSILYYHGYNKISMNELVDYLISSLNESIHNYDFEKFHTYKYNLLELRLLILVALTKVKCKDLALSNRILKFLLDYLLKLEELNIYEIKIVIKLYLNLSYNLHCLDLHEEAYKYSVKGIEYIISKDLIYCLPHLLGRKGIAEYFTSRDCYKETLKSAINVFRIKGDNNSANNYIRILKQKYNLNL